MKAELDGLNEAIGYRTLTAPIAGAVFDLKVSLSSVVAADQVLLKIVPSKRLQASIDVSNADIGFLKIGMPVDISVDSFPSGEFGYIVVSLNQWCGCSPARSEVAAFSLPSHCAVAAAKG